MVGQEEVEELLIDDERQEHTGLIENDSQIQALEVSPEISINVLAGRFHPSTLRVMGHYGKKQVKILIDNGSNNNFIKPEVADKLSLNRTTIAEVKVWTGSGAYLVYRSKCERVPLYIQGLEFVVDLFVLEIIGPEVVLGVQWLIELGTIKTIYQELTMGFSWGGKDVKLKGENILIETPCKGKKLSKLAALDRISKLYHLSSIEQQENDDETSLEIPLVVREVLQQYNEVFQEPKGLPPIRAVDHRIPLKPNAKPVNICPYKYPYFQKNEMERLVMEMQNSGIIRDSRSPFSSPVLLVKKKKDGTWHFCVDYRALNNITIKDRFLIPTTEEILDELHGATHFTKLDLRSGYHQIRMWEPNIPKTAFRTHSGHYEFVVMPFRLTNAPPTFQATTNKVFQPYLRFVAVFFDDILIYSKGLDEHVEHLKVVMETLKLHALFVKLSCTFAQESTEYLGHVVGKEGVQVDQKKIQAMINWSVPKNLKQLHGFLGLTGYYRKFVKGYTLIAQPLTELLKRNKFLWNEKATTAFVELKDKMTKTPVLRLPDFRKVFVVETDASNTGVGAVLT